jgi:hypothetical protein
MGSFSLRFSKEGFKSGDRILRNSIFGMGRIVLEGIRVVKKGVSMMFLRGIVKSEIRGKL